MDEHVDPPEARLPDMLLVTGMSGAGKTAAAAVLEDLGWYVVDNLPPLLLPALIEEVSRDRAGWRLAAVTDARSGSFFSDLSGALRDLRAGGLRPSVLYLEAGDEALVRRFESVRRPHPLQGRGRILEGIERERLLLADLRSEADLVIDTSALNVHELARRLRLAFGQGSQQLSAIVVTFGFKYGLPVDADLVADMRFLPNPFWVPELKALTGRDAEVSDYVLGQPGATEFLDTFRHQLALVSAGYLREGKRFVTVGIGCTGGKHRSVAMAESLAQRLRADGVDTLVVHRDLGRE